MNPKPDHKIAEPAASAGYAEALERPVDTGVGPDAAPSPLVSAMEALRRSSGTDSISVEVKAALEESLEDWEGLDQEADESSLPRPAAVAKKTAREFLLKVIPEVPRYYAVSMWDKGTVVVHTQDTKDQRIDVFFDAKGGAECIFTPPDSEDDVMCYYPQANQAASGELFAALRKMKQ